MDPNAEVTGRTGAVGSWFATTWRRAIWGRPISDRSALAAFLHRESAAYIQAPLFRHTQSVMRMEFQQYLGDPESVAYLDRVRWELFPAGLADVMEMVLHAGCGGGVPAPCQIGAMRALGEDLLSDADPPPSLGPESWARAARAVGARFSAFGHGPMRPIRSIPETTARDVYLRLPARPEREDGTSEFIRNQMVAAMCVAHERFVMRSGDRTLDAILCERLPRVEEAPVRR